MRRFSTISVRCGRSQKASTNVKPLRLRPPIESRASAVFTDPNHPLWQFFANKQYLRKSNELEDIGDSWSVPQLRRKSFEDLHTLWYVCIKELNKLNREMRLLAMYENRPSQDTKAYADDENRFAEVASKVKTTMWRIRHVLAERYHSYKSAQFIVDRPENWAEFKESYLTADSNADSQVNDQLERFQYAVYGINPLLQSNFAEPRVVKGLYEVARLKLMRYASEQSEVTEVNDIREAFTLFSSKGSPEGVSEAINTIKELRERDEPTPKDKDVEVLAEIIMNTRES